MKKFIIFLINEQVPLQVDWILDEISNVVKYDTFRFSRLGYSWVIVNLIKTLLVVFHESFDFSGIYKGLFSSRVCSLIQLCNRKLLLNSTKIDLVKKNDFWKYQ